MIRIQRPAEAHACPELASVRGTELPRVRQAIQSGRRPDQALLDTAYKVARHPLAQAQHHKCCYCEDRLQDARWEHVEHFRPKAEVRRTATSPPETGYWWLTWTWTNLLFSCIRCNNAKGSEFPLLEGSRALEPEQAPPGAERPGLVDPTHEDPRAHIQFRPFGPHWIPRPRTPRGTAMLGAVGLGLEPGHEDHRVGLQQEWDDHAARLRPIITAIEQAMETNDRERIRTAWARTRAYRVASQRFVALALDVLDHAFPEHVRRRWSLSLDVLRP